MTKLLLKAPWFVAAPAVVAIVAALAIVQNMWLSDYFIRSFVDQADPFAVLAAEATPVLRAAVDATPAEGGAAAAAATQPASTEPGVVAEGTFKDGDPGHNGSGTAKLQRLPDGSLNLRFEGFSVTGGPDLVVILSTDVNGGRGSVGSGLSLGALSATDGNQNYGIPAGTDLSKYRSVIIYCKSFPTVFAYAPLEAM